MTRPRSLAMPSATLLATVLCVVSLVAPEDASAQLPTDDRLARAALAWDRGDYVEALETYREVLHGSDADLLLREVAAATGEVYEVTELTPDGGRISTGPGGRYVTYETTVAGETVTKVVDLRTGVREVATLRGTDAEISAGGVVAYVVTERPPGLREAEEALEAARAARDRDAFFDALASVRWLTARSRTLHVRDLETGRDDAVDLGELLPGAMAWAPDRDDLFVVVGRPGEADRNDIVRVRDGTVAVVTSGPGFRAEPIPVRGGRLLVHTMPAARPVPTGPDVAPVEGSSVGFAVVDLETGREAVVTGAEDVTVSDDGSRVAWIGERNGWRTIESAPLELDALLAEAGPALVATRMEVDNPALSPDGRWVAYQKKPVHDWEIFAVRTADGEEIQLSLEIQHDLFPTWVDPTTVLAAKGEGRHRRSFLYDVNGDEPLKLFHNNTVRTIAPEYAWHPVPGGRAVVIQAERDGDTVSPERGVYLVHLDRVVTLEAVRERVEESLEAERTLREWGERTFRPIARDVREITEAVDVNRIHRQAEVLYGFGSKYITQPGNRLASDHLAGTLRRWGYEVELQWFEPRPGLRTANVIARLPGTAHPELVYVASSHFDSVERGPGADDNSSGTTALLEVARVMRDHPQEATIEFAFFTGEEAGLLGSREYVRRAVESGKRIVGALNNDMVGWANGPRLDNTIRYSNPGIRDIQHAAAILFSELILYDALYYKNTDAHAYYEEYGDIVGGIGSYPVLGNPHYHQFTDRLNTIDQRLVAEVGRVTAATLVALASMPSRVVGLELALVEGGVQVEWNPSPERDVDHYVVAWTDASGIARTARVTGRTSHTIRGVRDGTDVRVRAVDAQGMAGWDWARREVPR